MLRRLIYLLSEGIPPRKNFPAGLQGRFQWLGDILVNTPPGMARLMKLQPLFALASSVVVLVLFEKGFEKTPLVIVMVIFAFIYITYRLYLMKEMNGPYAALWDMALIFALCNSLLFVIPFYFESMTVPSRNMLFAPLILGLTVIANWFTLYQKLIVSHPLRSSLFYALTFFCALNFLLPVIFGMRNIWSLLISGGAAATAVAVFIYPHTDFLKSKKSTFAFFAGIAIFISLLWLGRSFIPPAPLKLTRATACAGIESYRPVDPFASTAIDRGQTVHFYTAIFAPRGLKEKINHVWFHNGKRLFTVHLSEISGGRREGFGTWSNHVINEGPGKYTVEVWTDGGQLLGGGSFRLDRPKPQPAQEPAENISPEPGQITVP